MKKRYKPLTNAIELISDLRITELTDEKLVDLLSKLRVSLGDLFRMYKLK